MYDAVLIVLSIVLAVVWVYSLALYTGVED